VQALKKPDTYGTATGLNCGGCLVFTWFPSIWASGEQVMNDDGTQSTLDGPVPTEVYDTWRDLWTSGAVLPASKDEAGPTWTAAFTEGKVGLMFYPATLLSSTPFDVGVAGIPGPDGGASTFVGGDGIGISKDSEKAAQAWNFLNWLMSEDAQVEVLAKNNDVVARSDLANNTYAAKDPRLVTINEVAAKGETPVALNFQQAFNAPNSPWLTLVRNAVLGDGSKVKADNEEITAVLGQ
jgi:multiple sugar transport system substrate-binding protein